MRNNRYREQYFLAKSNLISVAIQFEDTIRKLESIIESLETQMPIEDLIVILEDIQKISERISFQKEELLNSF
jgi:exonuclease VII small subunit